MTNRPTWNRNRVVRRKEGGEKVRGQWPWEAAQEIDLVQRSKTGCWLSSSILLYLPRELSHLLGSDLLPGLSVIGSFTVDSRLRRPARCACRAAAHRMLRTLEALGYVRREG